MKKLLIYIIDFFYKLFDRIRDTFYTVFDFFYSKNHSAPKVASVNDTINKIIQDECSIARFGDGEIKLVAGKDISFQKATPFAVDKLREVLSSNEEGLLIGIADIFGDRSRYSGSSTEYWNNHLKRYRHVWYRYLIKGKQYYNASFTRQYMSLKDKSASQDVFCEIKRIWDKKDVVIIEGEKSRFGIGNDLLSNAKSIRRIIGPSTQAFDKYDDILNSAKTLPLDTLFLLALGPCATALAYDLHNAGYRAVDIGHVDIEYEWFIMKASKKVPIKNKKVQEAVEENEEDTFSDPEYESQIISINI